MIIKNNNDNIYYLTEQESYKLNNIYTNNFGIYLNDIINFCEYNDTNNTTDIIKQIPNTTPVIINEEDVILEPDIVNLFENYVIKPISSYNKIYQECVEYTNNIINEERTVFFQTQKHPISRLKTHVTHDSRHNDEEKGNLSKIKGSIYKFLMPNYTSDASYMTKTRERILSDFQKMNNMVGEDKDPSLEKRIKKYHKFQNDLLKKDIKRLAKGSSIGIAATGLSASAIYKLAQKQKSPKSFIGKKISSFRKIYRNLINQANKNPKKAGMLKRVAAKILKVIDQLMVKLQNMAG